MLARALLGVEWNESLPYVDSREGNSGFVWALLAIVALPHLALAQLVNGFETEAQRLEAVRRLIATEPMPRPAETNDNYRQSGTTAPTCNALLQDLLAGKYKAIEPVQIRTREDWRNKDLGDPPSWQTQALNGFPKSTTKKLRYCASEEAAEKFKGIEAQFFFGFDSIGGPPPYRVYRLPVEVNPYPDAHFLYWTNYNAIDGHGSPYVWVNLDSCKPVFGAQAKSFDVTQGGNSLSRAQAIAQYRGKFTYLEAEKGLGFSIQHLEPGSIRADTVQRLGTHCSWATYPETPITK